MPFFTPENCQEPKLNDEEIELMNTRYDAEVEDIEPVNPDEGQTEETRAEEIERLIDSIRDDDGSAENCDVALLKFLHDEGETDLWFDDLCTDGDFYGSPLTSVGRNRQYAVIESDDIEGVFAKHIEAFVDDCVLPDIPEAYRNYFDTEKYTRDVEANDGYGGMATYDGNDNEVVVDGKYYHIFRMN